MKKQEKNEAQLSLFESNEPPPCKKPSIVDMARSRFEQNSTMNQEEYKKWINRLQKNSKNS